MDCSNTKFLYIFILPSACLNTGDRLTNYNGTVLIKYKYNAYGECTATYYNSGSSTTATLNPFRYRGYYFDKDLNLYYVNARYYDAKLCRWISPEPNVDKANFDVFNSITGYNLYAYCINNPANYYDDTGEWTFSLGVSFFASCLGGMSYTFMLSVDDDWNFGFQVTETNVFKEGSGVTIGRINAGISGKASVSLDADTVYDLNGTGFSAAASVGNWGAEASTSDIDNVTNGTKSFSVTYGKSIAPFDIAFSSSNTLTVWSVNIKKAAKNIWEDVKSWFK